MKGAKLGVHLGRLPWGAALDLAGLALIAYLFFDRFDLPLLLTDTRMTGGDSASWHQAAVFLRDVLIPNGRLFGWDQGNFFGYPNFQYYFVPPFLLAVLLGEAIPLAAALKLVSFGGVLLTPLSVYVSLRWLEYQRPIPLVGAWVSIVFLFHERFDMFGGNALSTLAGEFCYSIAFALQILFIGLAYRGLVDGRRLVASAILLASIGLTHAFVFLTAVFIPLYFVFHRHAFSLRFAYAFWMYLLAFLPMAFWVLPMVLQYEYTTPIRMIWRFFSAGELLAALNYEVLAAAGLLTLLALALRSPGPHLGFFLYMTAVSGLFYLVATALKIADIRFFPPLLFFALMVIVDCGAGLLRLSGPLRPLAATATIGLAVLAGGLWVYAPGRQAPDWFAWNYSGMEAKPGFRDGTVAGLAEALRAAPDAPRVAWEKTHRYDAELGSDRVFESIPLLFGRRSTEGIHYASALNSKAITWLHGEYSLATASPEALINPHYDLEILPSRFRLFNIDSILVRTPEMKQLFAESRDFRLAAEVGDMAVYRLAAPPPGYVSTPAFQPVAVEIEGEDWRHAVLAAFRRGEGMDVPLVVARGLGGTPAATHFPGPRGRLDGYGRAEGVERIPVPPAGVQDVRIDDFSIRFHTDGPGRPHLIRVAYSPNWTSRGGEAVYLVAPGLMLVYPETEDVELTYRRSGAERAGAVLTVLGAVLAVVLSLSAHARAWLLGMPWLGRLADGVWRLRWVLGAVVLAAAVLAGWRSYAMKQTVFDDYFAGNRLAAEGRTDAAIAAYSRAGSDEHVRTLDHPDIPNAIFALARLYRSLGNGLAAERELRRLLDAYPKWLYVHEVHLELGELLQQRGAERESRQHFQACARIDRFSDAGKRCRSLTESLAPGTAERTGGLAGP